MSICKAQIGFGNEVRRGGAAPHRYHLASKQPPITRVFKRHVEITSYHPAKSFSSMSDMNE